MNVKKIESAIETILFVFGDPINVRDIAEALSMPKDEVYDTILSMQKKYDEEGRGIVIRRVDKSFQLVSREENFSYVEAIARPIKSKKLSQSALEVLALIAYKQPITRGDIDGIRGVKSERVIEGLLEKGFVYEKGRSNAIGRPILYGTTEKFLRYMNIEDIKELPDIEGFDEDYEALSTWEKNQISIEDLDEKSTESEDIE